jgi:hypothetical protein
MERPRPGLRFEFTGFLFVGLVLVSSGCRSTKSEVPPGKPYQTTGGEPPSIGFSAEPHPGVANGMIGLYGNRGPGAQSDDLMSSRGNSGDVTFGTPTSANDHLGTPSDNRYGPPGTAGTVGSAPTNTAAVANSMLKAVPSASRMLAKDPNPDPISGGSPGGSYP